jgi:predicted alpha/beta superfamily hydrolase
MQKDTFEISSPQLGNRRNVDVYLPDSYGTGRRRYPVVYMQDGQNLSDPAIAFAGNTWHLEEGLTWLAKHGVEPIVVGVHNTGVDRMNEYSPFKDARNGGGKGSRYVRFLIDTVKARIDASYRTETDRARTVIAGSSMGGLISLYAFFRRPSPFGGVAIMSPSVWFAGKRILPFVERSRRTGGRIYLDVGTSEGAGELRDTRTLNRALGRKGFKQDTLRYVEAQGHQHREADWAWRLPQALEFLLREG